MALNDKAGGLGDPDLGDKLKEIPQDIAELVKHEIELAKAELSEKVEQVRSHVEQARREAEGEIQQAKSEAQNLGKKAGVGAGLFGAAGLLALGAFATATVFLVGVLAVIMPVWAAALVVTILYGAVAGAFAFAGKNKVKQVQQRLPEVAGHADHVKGVATSAVQRIRDDVPLAPERTLSSLKQSKEELAAAWQRGSNGSEEGPAAGDYLVPLPASSDVAPDPERPEPIVWDPSSRRP